MRAQYWTSQIFHLAMISVLIFVALFLATKFGLISCRVIPGWCDIYRGIVGYPRVLIVKGSSGLGDPDLLKDLLASRCRIFAREIHVNQLTSGVLSGYDAVIVTRARRMDVQKMKALAKYLVEGGRLVWTGDAGTEVPENEVVYEDELLGYGHPHRPVDPWTRKEGNTVIEFGRNVLSARYITNFCDANNISCKGNDFLGTLETPDRSHPLVQGLPYKATLRGNMAVVQVVEGDNIMGSPYVVLSVDTKVPIISGDERVEGPFPLIITTSMGHRVFYYAIPPEMICEENPDYCFLLDNLCDVLVT